MRFCGFLGSLFSRHIGDRRGRRRRLAGNLGRQLGAHFDRLGCRGFRGGLCDALCHRLSGCGRLSGSGGFGGSFRRCSAFLRLIHDLVKIQPVVLVIIQPVIPFAVVQIAVGLVAVFVIIVIVVSKFTDGVGMPAGPVHICGQVLCIGSLGAHLPRVRVILEYLGVHIRLPVVHTRFGQAVEVIVAIGSRLPGHAVHNLRDVGVIVVRIGKVLHRDASHRLDRRHRREQTTHAGGRPTVVGEGFPEHVITRCPAVIQAGQAPGLVIAGIVQIHRPVAVLDPDQLPGAVIGVIQNLPSGHGLAG